MFHSYKNKHMVEKLSILRAILPYSEVYTRSKRKVEQLNIYIKEICLGREITKCFAVDTKSHRVSKGPQVNPSSVVHFDSAMSEWTPDG